MDRPECVAAVDAFRAGTLTPFEQQPDRLPGMPDTAPASVPLARLSATERELYDTRVRLGAELLAAGKTEQVLTEWQQALRLDPTNYVLRKQVWKLRFPERFGAEIDFAWQKEQLARDLAAEADKACGPDGCSIP